MRDGTGINMIKEERGASHQGAALAANHMQQQRAHLTRASRGARGAAASRAAPAQEGGMAQPFYFVAQPMLGRSGM
jgi:hypothetical protein